MMLGEAGLRFMTEEQDEGVQTQQRSRGSRKEMKSVSAGREEC